MKQMNVRAEAALLEVARRHHTTVEEVRRGDPSGYGDGNV